jgi:TolB protein
VWSPVQAQIEITVPEPGGAGLPIALSPLANTSGGADQRLGLTFSDIIARDLDLSGVFRVIDRAAYLEGPEGLAQGEINFQQWSVLGALALVKGGFLIDGDALTVEARLFDVVQQRQLGGKRYRGTKKDLRRIAHRFADYLMLVLTGEEGPFSSKIAFVSKRAGGRAKEVYVTDLTGAEVQQITHARTLILGPSWSPRATDLFYISYKRGGPYPYRFELSSGKEQRLSKTVGYSGQWSPDGSRIVISGEKDGNTDLFLLSAEGREIRRLTTNDGIDVSPAWSPDGRQIAFCSSRGGGPQIYVMNIDSGKVRRITFQGNYNTSPVWSPKGDRIAYTSQSGGFHIMTVDVQGGERRKISAGEDASWSPDGRYLVFSSRGRLQIASRDGQSVKQLTGGGGDDTSPVWSARLE